MIEQKILQFRNSLNSWPTSSNSKHKSLLIRENILTTLSSHYDTLALSLAAEYPNDIIAFISISIIKNIKIISLFSKYITGQPSNNEWERHNSGIGLRIRNQRIRQYQCEEFLSAVEEVEMEENTSDLSSHTQTVWWWGNQYNREVSCLKQLSLDIELRGARIKPRVKGT